MKTKILLSLLLLGSIVISGCGVNSVGNETLSAPPTNFKMDIVKSEVNINSVSFQAKNDSTVKDLLIQSNIKYQLRGEQISELDGVIATASKVWNVYVDEAKSNLNTEVKSGSKVEWKYEAK